MDELNNGEQGQYVEPGKNEKKNNTRKIVKRTLLTAGLALAVYMVYSIVYLFISPDRNIQQIYLVPEDAAFIIQSSAPIEDWEKFSGSETRLSKAIKCCYHWSVSGICLSHFIRPALPIGIFCL